MPELQHIVRVEMELGRRGFDLVDDDLLAKSGLFELDNICVRQRGSGRRFSELPCAGLAGALARAFWSLARTRLHDL